MIGGVGRHHHDEGGAAIAYEARALADRTRERGVRAHPWREHDTDARGRIARLQAKPCRAIKAHGGEQEDQCAVKDTARVLRAHESPSPTTACRLPTAG